MYLSLSKVKVAKGDCRFEELGCKSFFSLFHKLHPPPADPPFLFFTYFYTTLRKEWNVGLSFHVFLHPSCHIRRGILHSLKEYENQTQNLNLKINTSIAIDTDFEKQTDKQNKQIENYQ